MKVYEMTNLFIGYNEEEDFKILICALDSLEAYELAREYGCDAHLDGEWDISEFDEDSKNTRFDCDYVIA